MTSWLARAFRGWRLDHNPLRRPSDRFETIADVLLVVALAAAAPLTVHAAAAGTYALAQHARATALATRHEVTAVTLQAAVASPASALAVSWISAGWAAPDGRPRTGLVKVATGTPKGSPERIWVTGSGDMAPPPLQVPELAEMADCAAAGAGVGLAVLFLVTRTTMRRALSRHRMAAWEAEWAAVEPRWSPQHW
jgi:hypothetical protein